MRIILSLAETIYKQLRMRMLLMAVIYSAEQFIPGNYNQMEQRSTSKPVWGEQNNQGSVQVLFAEASYD